MDPLYEIIPQRILDGLSRYIKDHIPTGQFLHAVLTNDLTEAVGRADDECTLALPAIVKWLYNEAPATCWGSPEKVKQWLATPPRVSARLPAESKVAWQPGRIGGNHPDPTGTCTTQGHDSPRHAA